MEKNVKLIVIVIFVVIGIYFIFRLTEVDHEGILLEKEETCQRAFGEDYKYIRVTSWNTLVCGNGKEIKKI